MSEFSSLRCLSNGGKAYHEEQLESRERQLLRLAQPRHPLGRCFVEVKPYHLAQQPDYHHHCWEPQLGLTRGQERGFQPRAAPGDVDVPQWDRGPDELRDSVLSIRVESPVDRTDSKEDSSRW